MAAALLGLLFVGPVKGQERVCFDRGALVSQLDKDYGERKALTALSGVGTLLELFVSKNETWTMVESLPDGRSCPISSGVGIQMESLFYGEET